MTNSRDEMTMERLAARLAELEEAQTHKLAEVEQTYTRRLSEMEKEMAMLRAERSAVSRSATKQPQERRLMRAEGTPGKTAPASRKSRRELLRQGLGVAAAVVGAGALLEVSAEQAVAAGPSRRGVSPDDNIGNFSSSNLKYPAVTATGTNGADGIDASSDTGIGVLGGANKGIGVYGESNYNYGVYGVSYSTNIAGVQGEGTTGVYGKGSTTGVHGQVNGTGSAIWGENQASGYGVYATSASGEALSAVSTSNNAIHAIGGGVSYSAVVADGGSGIGVTASASGAGSIGVYSSSDSGYGMYSSSTSGYGVLGASTSGYGVFGYSTAIGVYGQGGSGGASPHDRKVLREIEQTNAPNGAGLYGTSSGIAYGVYAENTGSGTALVVSGTITVSGNAVGKATLSSGKKSVTVTTPAATTASNIVLTPLGKYKGTVWVTLASGSFTINSSVNQSSNVAFSYLIIN